MNAPCAIPGCENPYRARGWCMTHYMRWRSHGNPLHISPKTAARTIHIEDVEWMADTGETFEGAAKRLGVKPDTLERRLEREGRTDLAARMRKRVSRV